MKKGITLLVGFAMYMLFVANSSGGPAQSTGAPDEQTCGRSGCHAVDANVGDAMLNLNFDGTTDGYEPNATYTLTVALQDVQSDKNGFQIVALDAENKEAGAWTITDASAVQSRASGALNRTYLTHTTNGNRQAAWSFDWTAPSDDVGAITFYVSALDADDSGSKTGDNLYTTSSILTKATTSSLEVLNAAAISIYPNPASERLYLDNFDTEASIRIYDINGQLVKQVIKTNTIELADFKAGVYLLQVQDKTAMHTKQFVVQK